MEETELIDRTPSTYKGGTRHPMVMAEPADLSPRLPQQSAGAIVQAILAQPAPVPQRTANTVERVRLNGDGKADPLRQTLAGLARVAPLAGVGLFLAVPLAILAYRVDGLLSLLVMLIYVLAVVLLVERENKRTLKFSQAGVEVHRADLDHALETQHEQNRHAETMTAIQGDIAVKLKVLDLASGYSRLAYKKAAND